MSKRNSILITAAVVLTALSAAVMIFALKFYTPRAPVYTDADAAASETDGAAKPFSDALTASGELEYPLLPTDFDGIFYVADPTGGAVFLRYDGGSLSPYAGEVRTVAVAPVCSYDEVPATVSYITVGGRVCGYGLYTAVGSGGASERFDYMFFKLTQLPGGYGSGDALLLCDRDSADLCSPDKLWEEAFTVEMSSGETTRIAPDSGRSFDGSGAMRSDWAMLTDAFLRRGDSRKLFLTGRDKTLDKKGLLTDIIEVDRSAYTRDERVVTDILGTWFAADEQGWHFLRVSDAGGFSSVALKDGRETTVKELSDSYEEAYLKCGDRVLNKKTLTLTDLITGKDELLPNEFPSRQPSYFTVSPDGDTVLLAYSGVVSADDPTEEARQALVVCSVGRKTLVSYEEPALFFENYPNFMWTQSGALIFTRPPRGGETLGYGILF